MKNFTKKLIMKTENALDLSGGILRGLPNIILYGTEQADIDNFKALLDFSPSAARINTSDGIVRIDGTNLTIAVMTDESISIKGNIRLLSFE